MKQLSKFDDVFFNSYSQDREPISNPRGLKFFWLCQFCKTAGLLFLYVANIDTISTGSGMGVHEAECLPAAQLFTKRQIVSLNN